MHVLTLPALPLSCPVLPVLPLSCLSVALFFLETCYSERWVLQFNFNLEYSSNFPDYIPSIIDTSFVHAAESDDKCKFLWHYSFWWHTNMFSDRTASMYMIPFHKSYFCSHGSSCWQMCVLTLPLLPCLAQVRHFSSSRHTNSNTLGERWCPLPHFYIVWRLNMTHNNIK